MKLLKDDNTAYCQAEFHGGGKTISLITYKNTIVVPARLQKHVIMWYQTMLCHPGITELRKLSVNTPGGPRRETTSLTMLRYALYVKKTRGGDKRSMGCYYQKKPKQHHGTTYLLI